MARDREDFTDWKDLSTNELNEMMRTELPVRPPIWKKLQKHQRVCLLLGALKGSWAFFLDTGCGKTLLSIALARYLIAAKRGKRFLVLVPNNVNTFEWGLEIQKHAPSMKYTILEGSTEQKWKAFTTDDSTLYITTYMGLLYMVSTETKTKKGKIKFNLKDSLINKMAKMIDGCFFDESTELGNPNSLTYRICRKFIKTHKKLAFPLSGTPFGRDPKKLWAQMFLVDGGHALGETLGLFQSSFYKEKKNHWSGFPEYTFNKKLSPLLHDFINHRSIAYEAEGLPGTIEILKEVPLSKDAQVHAESARDEFLEAVKAKGAKDIRMIKNTFLRMRQISSGFIGYHDDDLGKRAALEFDDNPKLDMLLHLLGSLPEKHKAIVFVQFTFSGGMISRELTANKIGHTRIFGGTKDQDAELRKFKSDKKCRVLVLNNDCGGFGLNLQVAKYGIYYETPVCPIMRKQTRRRFERQHSEHKRVSVYDLVTRNTYDQQILDALKEGENLFDNIMRGGMTRLRG